MSRVSRQEGEHRIITFYNLNSSPDKSAPIIYHGFPRKLKKKILLKFYKNPVERDEGINPNCTDVKFPTCCNRVPTVRTMPASAYVNNNKACCKLRGINPNHIFSIRTKRKPSNSTNNSVVLYQEPQTRPQTSIEAPHLPEELWKIVLSSMGGQLSVDESRSAASEDMEKSLTEKLEECDEELGVIQKKAVIGRKLGDVLTTKRLKQILKKGEEGLPDIFCKHRIHSFGW